MIRFRLSPCRYPSDRLPVPPSLPLVAALLQGRVGERAGKHTESCKAYQQEQHVAGRHDSLLDMVSCVSINEDWPRLMIQGNGLSNHSIRRALLFVFSVTISATP
jgi:hypothetical protein